MFALLFIGACLLALVVFDIAVTKDGPMIRP